MLMVAILAWGKDLLIQQAQDMVWVRRMKHRLGPETDIVVYDGAFLFPLRLDIAWRQLQEDEVIEFLHTSSYPLLVEENRITLKNGNPRKNVQIPI